MTEPLGVRITLLRENAALPRYATEGAAACDLTAAIDEILTLTLAAFVDGNTEAAMNVEPLEQVIDALKEQLRTGHILRLQQGQCSIETGFVWSDILTTLERTSDHCSNVAGCVLDAREHSMNLHQSLRLMKTESEHFRAQYETYAKKYMPEA